MTCVLHYLFSISCSFEFLYLDPNCCVLVCARCWVAFWDVPMCLDKCAGICFSKKSTLLICNVLDWKVLQKYLHLFIYLSLSCCLFPSLFRLHAYSGGREIEAILCSRSHLWDDMQSVFEKHQDATLFCPHYSWEATNGSVESQWNHSHNLLEPGFSSAAGRLDGPDSCRWCGSGEGPGEWIPLQDVSDPDFWCWLVSLCGDCLVSRWWWHVAWSSEWLIQPYPDRLPDIRLV